MSRGAEVLTIPPWIQRRTGDVFTLASALSAAGVTLLACYDCRYRVTTSGSAVTGWGDSLLLGPTVTSSGSARPTVGTSALSVTGITRSSNTATATTSVPHGYQTGFQVTVAGADQADYNITATITVTGATTFTYTVANTPTTPATGTITCQCPTALSLLFNGTAQYLRADSSYWGAVTGPCAVVAVGTVPAASGATQAFATLSATNVSTAVTPEVTSTGQVVTVLNGGVSGAVSNPASLNVLVVHGRRGQSGGTGTAGVQIGSGAETTGAGAAAAVVANRMTVGADLSTSPTGFGTFAARAILVMAGDYSGHQSIVNTWAATYHGATL